MVATGERSDLVLRLYEAFPRIPDQNTFYGRAELELKQALSNRRTEVGNFAYQASSLSLRTAAEASQPCRFPC